ncbi:hypothetical protein Bca101_076500 [Brassica carinata]
MKRKEAAAKRRAAAKKKRDAAKRSETTEKKRKRDRGLDGGSSSNPTKRARNRVRETAASPPEHQGVHSSTPAAEFPSQGDSEGTPRPVIPSQPQKSPTPTHAASEAENPQQPRVTSGSSTKSPSHRVDEQNGEVSGSNNRDSNAPEVTVDNDAPRTVDRDDMTVEAYRPAGFFFKPSDYGKGCKLSSSILEPQGYEADLLYEIMDEGTYENLELIDDSDMPDIAADSWNKILLEPGRGEAGGEAGGEADRESLRELELKLNKRMDDGFALRDETIRLLAARVKELEQDKIQRESWSFQFGEAETGYALGGRRRDKVGDEEAEMHGDKEGDEKAEKHGDKEGDEEAEKQGLDDYEADKEGEDNGDKDGDEAEAEKDGDEAEAEKDGEKQIEAEAEKDDEKDGEKQIEAEAEKLMQDTDERFDDDGDEQSTLQIMANTAERFEKAAAEKSAADKTNEVVDDDDALEKEGEVGVDDYSEEADSVGVDEMPKRVPKRSHLLRSPFTPN